MQRSFDDIVSDLRRLGLMNQKDATALFQRDDRAQDDITTAEAAEMLTSSGCVSPLQADKILSNRTSELQIDGYLLIRLIASGGMGQVFLARHQMMERIVALKTIKRELLSNNELVSRFHREIKVLAKLSHRNILTAHDAGTFGEVPYLVTEYIEGVDLQREVDENGPLTLERAKPLFRQMIEAIAFAHDHGVIHRDIKPGNVMLQTQDQVKILDLGLARLLQQDQGVDTRTGQVLGTPSYMAPEQASGLEVGHSADIFALGRTFRFMLVGYPRLTSDLRKREEIADAEFSRKVPHEIRVIYDKMVEFDPLNRYQSLHSVLDDLQWFDNSAADIGRVDDNDSIDDVPRRQIQSSIEQLQLSTSLDSSSKISRRTWISLVLMAVAAFLILGVFSIARRSGSDLPEKIDGKRSKADSGSVILPEADLISDMEIALRSPINLTAHDGEVAFVEFTPDSNFLLTGGWDGGLIVWRAGTDDIVWRVDKPHPDRSPDGLLACECLDHGKKIAVGTSFGTVQIFDLVAKRMIREFQVFDSQVDFFYLCELDGGKLAVGTEGKKQPLTIWDFNRTDEPLETHLPHRHGIVGVHYDPNQTTIVSGGVGDAMVKLLSRDGNWRTYAGFPDDDDLLIFDLDIVHQERSIYVAFEKELSRWNLDQEGQSAFRSRAPHKGSIWCVSASESGPVSTGSDDGHVVIWDRDSGEVLQDVAAFDSGVNSVALSADGRWLAAGCEDTTIKVWPLGKTENKSP